MTKPRLAAEAALIFVLAAAFGMFWNRQLLVDTWSGRTSQAVERPATADALPLPAGLLQVKEMFDRKEAVMVDARDPDAFAAGRIAGAVSLPVGEIATQLPGISKKISRERTVVVYCNGYGCHDSMTVGTALLKAGYRTVFVFEGGYPEWQEAGYPVEEKNK